MKKHLSLYLCTFLISFLFLSCSNDDDNNKAMYVTIASEERLFDGGITFDPYWAKTGNENEWKPLGLIEGFEYEQGYEYNLKIFPETSFDGEKKYNYKLLELISKKKKESEDIAPQYFSMFIASKKAPDNGSTPYYPYYFRNFVTGEWELLPAEMEEFDYEEGNEYLINVERRFNGVDVEPKFSYIYKETYGVTKKESENLP